jgi:hypothetical protein
MNADANGHSSATLRILMTPDMRSSRSSRQPTPDARAQADLLLIDADHHMQTRVKHPDGGERTAAETQADERAQRGKIIRETDMGSRKHYRLPPRLHWIPKLVLLFNFLLLLYFFAGSTSADRQSPPSVDLAFAGALAALITVLSYGIMAFTGLRLRWHKDTDGIPDVHALDGLTKVVAGAATVVIAVLAALMYVRMHAAVLDALGDRAGETALVVPLSVAVVGAAANSLVVLIYALDGSDDVTRLDRLAAATRRPARKARELRRRAAQQAHR